jgi:hypothetical protein
MHLLCEISILKYCLVVELFEKWQISPTPQSCDRWRTILVTPHMRGATFGCHSGGGGVCLGCPLAGFPQTQGNILFLPRSPYLHDFLLMFLILYSPLETALLLVLMQPSGDGYFRLCSSKSSFRGTIFIVLL